MNAFRKSMGVMLLLMMAAFVGEAQVTSTRQSVQSTRQVLNRIQDRIDLLRSRLVSTNRSDSVREENAGVLLANFEQSVRQLQQGLNRRTDSTNDVQSVLDRATALDNFIRRRTVDATSQRYWSNVRTDLTELARIYGLTWNADNRFPSDNRFPGRGGNTTARLTGTYTLDSGRSDDPAAAIDRAIRTLPYQERQQRREQLLRRLDPPQQIAIDVKGRSVTLASSRAQQINFDADGREHVESTPGGRTIRVTSSLTGEQLTIATTGDRDNQFNVTFVPMDFGRRLKVTRRIYTENLGTPVEIQSYYDKSSEVAQLDIYTGPRDNPTNDNNSDFLFRNGETVIAELNTSLSSRTSQEGDRFTATVKSPSQYAEATIEGHVTGIKRSGRVTGRSELTFNFDRIRLRDGRSYAMAGYLRSVRLTDGDTVKVDNEGAVQEDSQSNKTIERTAIGTAVGAIIGAIAGGGKGAAIGAVVGAGGGAGSVYIQGRNDLELPIGTELTIQATGPR
ncbi:MAG TPA: YMGG-like glycine zipper-containing protein [Pyrinomonadaceae bacterium]|nr:YMGG-like glycine zipper-containing protein [Pyrinomonadaceae bacterium]